MRASAVVEPTRAARWAGASGPELFATVALAYALLAFSAYELFGALTIGVTFFPPAGLTYACFLTLPRRRWPLLVAAIWVGEVTVNLVESQPFWWSLGWAAANSTEPMVGAAVTLALVRGIAFDRQFATGFLVGGLVVGPAVGASIGATVLALANDFRWFDGWIDVWVGDALGVLVVAPAVIAYLHPGAPHRFERRDVVVVTAAVAALGALFFATEGLPLGYVMIPLLAWVALRLGVVGLAVCAAVFAAIVTAATAIERGQWAPTADLGAQEQLTRQQFFMLIAIGGAWILALEARRRVVAVEQAAAVRADLDRALERSRFVDEMQRALLPRRVVSTDRVAVAGFYLPASDALEVGGDWYDMSEHDDGVVHLVVGDVVGHGVEAAALMGQLSSAARTLAMTVRDPARVIGLLDRVATANAGAECSTLVCATFDPSWGVLQYTRAGHPPPLVRLPGGEILTLEGAGGPPLACGRGTRGCETVQLPPGSVLLMYTDGLVEWRGSSPDVRIAQLAAHLRVARSTEPDEIVAGLVTAMTAVTPPTDDMAVLCLVVREQLTGA